MSKFLNSRRFVAYAMFFILYLVGADQDTQTVGALYKGVLTVVVMLGSYEIAHRMVMAMINYKRGLR